MRLFKTLLVLLALGLVSGLTARAKGPQLYTCGMHPQIIQDHPGNCPICGMKLTPLPDDASGNGGIVISPETMQRMNLKTSAVTRGPVEREIRAVGSVTYDEAGLRDITLKYDGWIEELFVNATSTVVAEGDPLFRIYSPDLYNAQLNYLVTLRTEGDANGPLTRAARTRLELFDLPADFIAALGRTGTAERTYVYRAPSAGVVIEKPVVVGRMVRAGELIYRVATLDPIWITAQFYAADAAFIHPGQSVRLQPTHGDRPTVTGTVQLIEPQFDDATRTLMARIVVPNADHQLRPGMYVDVRFTAHLADDAVLVPATAVLRSGEHNTVFVALPAGRFDPREITLGPRTSDDHYAVTSGLNVGDTVVTSGQFMLDSESQLREGIQKMLAASGHGDHVHASVHPTPPSSTPRASSPAATSPLPPAGVASLTTLARAGADAAAALAGDNLSAYQQSLPALNAALAGFHAARADSHSDALAHFRSLPDRATLADARRDFEPFSTALVDLVRANHLTATTGLHAFECPMAPELGTGRWLQREPQIRNPFFGSTMLTCGDALPEDPARL